MLYQLSYTRISVVSPDAPPSPVTRDPRLTTHDSHGGGRIRTYVGQSPADLQSATISHSVTPPSQRVTLIRDRTPPAEKRGPGHRRCRRHRADEGNRTPNLPLTRRVLCQLSYVSLEQAESKTDSYHRGQVGLSQWGGFGPARRTSSDPSRLSRTSQPAPRSRARMRSASP
jgi:hypothetical protein